MDIKELWLEWYHKSSEEQSNWGNRYFSKGGWWLNLPGYSGIMPGAHASLCVQKIDLALHGGPLLCIRKENRHIKSEWATANSDTSLHVTWTSARATELPVLRRHTASVACLVGDLITLAPSTGHSRGLDHNTNRVRHGYTPMRGFTTADPPV